MLVLQNLRLSPDLVIVYGPAALHFCAVLLYTKAHHISQKILQINFRFDIPVAEYKKVTAKVAGHFAVFPGLQWKIWLMNEERKEAGGIYLFETEEALEQYLESALFKGLETLPGITGLEIKWFDILQEPGQLSRAPLSMQAVL